MKLSDGVITLRAPEPADLELLYAWENDPRMWDTGDTAAPMSRHMLERFIDGYDGDITSTRQLRLVVTLDAEGGRAAGTVDLFDFSAVNRRCGIGILVDEALRRRGIGLRALELTACWARRRLNLASLWCTVAADNAASLALFDRAGYRRVGVLKDWTFTARGLTDTVLLQLSL